ncbi:hypothetical protein C8Q74DRAFT_1363475 [Fomes fomentarius]|nr:hypothetical protein C8Q74DRAFT_1363475 [Fomes fomentarius]
MPRVRAAIRPAPGRLPYAHGGSTLAKKPHTVRSASVVPILPPSPPQSRHKRKRRSRSRVTDSSSEDEDEYDVPALEPDKEEEGQSSQDGAVAIGYNKRKMSSHSPEGSAQDCVEDEFWLGTSQGSSTTVASTSQLKVVKNRAPTRHSPRSRIRLPSSSPPPATHLSRRGHTGLLSPPPSRRAPVFVPRPATPPRTESGNRRGLPERDSPNNPFLEPPANTIIHVSEDWSLREPRTPPPKMVERPTISVLFRGVKAEVSNPHYVPEHIAADNEARARLPVWHPEYSPSQACVPTLLFPGAQARAERVASRRADRVVSIPTSPTPAYRVRASPSAVNDTSSTTEDEGKMISAVKAAKVAQRTAHKDKIVDSDTLVTRPSSRIDSLAGLPEKGHKDPVVRAIGPARCA